ncbi:MAG: hypothetical protein Q9183_003729 [Haloplaca sp. 2 TL-2023]
MSLYMYDKLDPTQKQIRICTIHPGAFDDPIRCSLHTVSLDDNPKYETLSYAWGAPIFDHEILVDGSILKVTKNLHNALRYLRRQERLGPKEENKSSSTNDISDSNVTKLEWDPEASGVLWADAICINQADIDERSSQVRFMGDIYRRGEGLHVWIGTVQEIRDSLHEANPPETQYDADYVTPERLAEARTLLLDTELTAQPSPLASAACSDADADVKGAMEILQLFAEDKHAYELPLFKSTAIDSDLEKDDFWHKCMAMLLGILTQPWWKRVWVVQEVLLSSTAHGDTLLHISHHKTPLASCHSLRLNFETHYINCCSRWNVTVFGNPQLLRRNFDAWKCLRNLTDLQECHMNGTVKLNSSHGDRGHAYGVSFRREATDPHDYIYGFRGLIDDFPSGLKVDYRSPVSHLYALATKTILREEISLDCLDWAVGTGAQNQHNLPSWSLDWSKNVQQEDNSSFLFPGQGMFNAAQGYPHTPSAASTKTAIGSFRNTRRRRRRSKRPSHLPSHLDDEDENIQVLEAIPAGTIQFINSVIDKTSGNPVDQVLSWMKAIGRQDFADIKTIVQVLMRDQYMDMEEKTAVRISSDPDLMKTVMELAGLIGSHRFWLDNLFTDSQLQMIGFLIMYRQRLFISSHGRLGSGRPTTREGDCVFVAKGSVCPLILRPVHGPAQNDALQDFLSYQFVSRSYVDGIMDGEAVSEDTKWQTVCLV